MSDQEIIEGDSEGLCKLKKWTQPSGPTLLQLTLEFSNVELSDDSRFQVTGLAGVSGLVDVPTTFGFTLINNETGSSDYRVGTLTLTPFGDIDGVFLNPNFGEATGPASVTLSIIL